MTTTEPATAPGEAGLAATDLRMPRLSDAMEEGTIVGWLKDSGAQVAAGEDLVEVETDKATVTHPASASGYLHVVARVGETVAVGELIARITASAAPPRPASSSPPRGPEGPPDGTSEAPPRARPDGPKASPVARRLAETLGIALETVQGTGPGGRILREDVEAARSGEPEAPAASVPEVPAASPSPAAPAATAPLPPPGARGEVTVTEPTRAQQLVARRMAETKATVPDFTVTVRIDMEACVDLRAQLKALADGAAPSYNDMVVKASALALREVPRANGAYRDGRFEHFSRVNVGIAVAAGDGLVVPTVFDADTRSLGDIAAATRELAARVRAGTITPPELAGQTFTVSNLGMFGVLSFEAVINSPQAAILAVGAVVPEPAVHDGAVVSRHVMRATLTCDHRIVYGAQAARLLARIRALLEQPAGLLL